MNADYFVSTTYELLFRFNELCTLTCVHSLRNPIIWCIVFMEGDWEK